MIFLTIFVANFFGMTTLRQYAILILSAFVCITADAQTDSVGRNYENRVRNIAFGKGSWNIGIAGHVDSLARVQANLLLSSARYVRGVQLSTLMNATRDLRGFQWGVLHNISGNLHGLQMATMNNVATSPIHGVQLSGFSNVAMGVDRGLQAALTNISTSEMRGAQVGFYNYADTATGAQVGLVNVAQSHPRGWQAGIVNYTNDKGGRKLGLVNINPDTKIDAMFFLGNSSKLNAALRFRNKSTYNIVGVGSHYMGLDDHFSGAVFYRLGQYFDITDRFSLSGDIGYYHIETFEENTASKPERLYSVRAHLNADYQLSPTVGIYGSIGYGDTRYYSHFDLYKHEFVGQLGLTFRYHRKAASKKFSKTMFSLEEGGEMEANPFPFDHKRPWLAAAEVTAINVFVHCLDRFPLQKDYAQVNLHTIHRNFKTGFVWDNDAFMTNLFAHPYHGNLYFNSARSCGMNFWQSAPYALCGSLMWEFFGECEPPSPNDVFATTFGGISIGEMTYRLSDIVLDDHSRGFRRFLREAAGFVISPMKGLNRIISGKAWQVDPSAKPYPRPDNLDFMLTVGGRYVADDGALFRGEGQTYLEANLEYGDVMGGKDNRPYDFFSINAGLGVGGNQPFINNLHIMGRLWSSPTVKSDRLDVEVGVFQHFDYYNSEAVKRGSGSVPFRISEAAALGPSFVFRYKSAGSLAYIEQRSFVNAILLGGSKSDYFNNLDRDYNLGSGFSLKLHTLMSFRKLFTIRLMAEKYRLFTWKGYEKKDLSTINPTYLNAQGDKSIADLTVLISQMNIGINEHLNVELAGCYFIRNTYYKYYDNVSANTFEVRAGLGYVF